MTDINTRTEWHDEDEYWRQNFRRRPYASAEYLYYQPGYRFGFESANRYPNRAWDDVEDDLSREWDVYEHRGTSTWEQIKDAVRDAWDRVTGNRPVGARE